MTDEIARRSPLLFRQKNETLKSFEEWRQLGAFMFPVAHPIRQTTRETSGWRGRIVGGGW
jgi:hypothetical protein